MSGPSPGYPREESKLTLILGLYMKCFLWLSVAARDLKKLVVSDCFCRFARGTYEACFMRFLAARAQMQLSLVE
eukprot:2093771-Pleurochrysis_carterae.AAC.1